MCAPVFRNSRLSLFADGSFSNGPRVRTKIIFEKTVTRKRLFNRPLLPIQLCFRLYYSGIFESKFSSV